MGMKVQMFLFCKCEDGYCDKEDELEFEYEFEYDYSCAFFM